MIKRSLSTKLKSLFLKFPVVAVTGPRQSGKTTLVKHVFSGMNYVSLEDLDTREFALKDPRGFLANYDGGAIIDEIQRAPALFSYIQTAVDAKKKSGRFVLTGSQNFLLQENISQTLAGRVAILKLLPFDIDELRHAGQKIGGVDEYIFKGLYPPIYDKKISPVDWYPNYIQTYVERDVRLIKNITDLAAFQRFLKMCAGRIAQPLNLSSLGNDCGITHNTAKAWLSVLEASYIIFLLKPFHKNFNKRLTKMPKLYFYDTGLACSLLGLQDKKQLAGHYARGSLFESFVISEIIKEKLNRGEEPGCYYWRDKKGNEVDCVIDTADGPIQVEIKSGMTIADDYFDGLRYWNKVAGTKNTRPFLIYGGNENQRRSFARVLSWKSIPTVFAQ